jgi:hypothetical protein
MEALEGQTVLIDAAVAAGVRRFIPSDYGTITTNKELHGYPGYASFAKIQNYLVEKSKTSRLSYTILATGGFLDMLFGQSGIVDFDNHKVVLYDGGESRISSTSFASVGNAVVGILNRPGETSNRILRVSQAILTQNKVLTIAKDMKPEISWEITPVKTSEMMQEALAAFAAGDFSHPIILKFVISTVFAGDRYGAAYDATDNALLGVEELTEEELRKMVADRLG